MSRQRDFPYNPTSGDGICRPSILRFFGRGPGFLGNRNPGNNLPKFQRDLHQARSEFLLYLRRSYGNEVG